jgi:TPR repeat protein
VKQNLNTAVSLSRQSAEQNYPDAEYFLGFCYLYGRGVPKDIPGAIELWTRAAVHDRRRTPRA